MTVTAVNRDVEGLTLSVTAEFDAPAERIWQLWSDPRQLERWWGPPTYPATVDAHDLRPGGTVDYHMTGPEGDQPRGHWDVLEVSPPHRLVFHDGIANDDGSRNSDYPVTTATVSIMQLAEGRTRMEIESVFPTRRAMEQLLAMGMEEGLSQAVGQIDALIAEQAVASK